MTANRSKSLLPILQSSPLDTTAVGCRSSQERPENRSWVPSRYNIRAKAADGRLILWNTLSSAMNVFEASQAEQILPLLKRAGVDGERQGLIGYMVDRGYLVPRGGNEYRRFQLAFGRQHYRPDHLELILLASEDCNFRCTYCYEDFQRGTMRPDVRASVRRLVERKLDGLRSLKISWFGGEPLYGLAAIDELAPFFDQVATERNLTFRSEMTTNGYLLTPDVAERLLRWRIRGFQITLDGPAEQHDRSRPTRDGRPTFETIVENLVALSRRDESFYVTIRNNFDQTNHDAVPELIETLEERLGGDSRFRLAFQAVGRWGGQNDEQLAVCNDDQSELVTARLHDEARRRGFDVPTLREVAHVGGQACYAARPYNLIVGAHGQLMKCTVILDSQDYNVVGKLGSDGEVQLDEERFALWTEPAFEQDTQCQKCVVVPLCQGIHCPKVRFEHDRSPCCSTRSRAKKELLDLVSVSKHRERKRSVALEA